MLVEFPPPERLEAEQGFGSLADVFDLMREQLASLAGSHGVPAEEIVVRSHGENGRATVELTSRSVAAHRLLTGDAT